MDQNRHFFSKKSVSNITQALKTYCFILSAWLLQDSQLLWKKLPCFPTLRKVIGSNYAFNLSPSGFYSTEITQSFEVFPHLLSQEVLFCKWSTSEATTKHVVTKGRQILWRKILKIKPKLLPHTYMLAIKGKKSQKWHFFSLLLQLVLSSRSG